MKKLILVVILPLAFTATASGQIDQSLLRRIPLDTVKQKLNMDATYNRPFLQAGKLPVALGGYVEANYQYLNEDGISEGHQFQMRRLTIIVASTKYKRKKILSEI